MNTVMKSVVVQDVWDNDTEGIQPSQSVHRIVFLSLLSSMTSVGST
jgi:hypothetical protein